MRVERSLTVINKLGLHARAATQLATLAKSFSANIMVSKDDKQVSADSVLGIMMLEASQNKEVQIICEGDDAQLALDAVEELFSARFNEDE